MFSAFNPSKCTHLEQWAADCAAPGEQSWTSFRSRDSNPQPWVTSGSKSNALSIRPTTARKCKFISRNSDFISQNREFTSSNSEKKSLNCEIKSRNNFFKCFIQWRKRASITIIN